MFTLVKMDLKQRIKHPLTWFIILILCIMSMLNIIETKNARLNRRFRGHDVYSLGSGGFTDWTFGWGHYYGEKEMTLYPKAYYSDSMLNKVQEDLLNANKENNIKEITRLMSFYDLLHAKASSITNDSIVNKIFEKKVKDIWSNVSGGIPYEDIEFILRENSDSGNWFLLSAKYYYQLYLNNLDPVYSDNVNNITYLYEYFFNILPKFINIVPILFIYNSINKERNIGSLKLVLTQSISRWKYYISKWLSGITHIIFTLFLPPTAISMLLGFKNGFVPLSYPTLYLKDTMTSFKTIPNYMDAIKIQKGNFGKFGHYESTFSYFAPKYDYMNHINIVDPHDKIEVIPFYKYLLMVILLTILFIAFGVALTQLISAIINKEIISFVATSAVFALGILVSNPFKYNKHLNLSPFTMENASRIVIGTYNVTALASTLILAASTILLLIAGTRYFKRKEI